MTQMNILNTEGHFYVYTESLSFSSLNLSDSGYIPLINNKYSIVKVPKDAEVLTYWELKFYTAKNWQTYKHTSPTLNINIIKSRHII